MLAGPTAPDRAVAVDGYDYYDVSCPRNPTQDGYATGALSPQITPQGLPKPPEVAIATLLYPNILSLSEKPPPVEARNH